MPSLDWNIYLNQLDDSHIMTTSKKHIRILCELIEHKRWNIIEFGSHLGLSTSAIALASPQSKIISIDLSDTIQECTRVELWSKLNISNIHPYTCSTVSFLKNNNQLYDFIFHDALHGSKAMEEYIECSKICNILAIHDFEQLINNDRNIIQSVFRKTYEDYDDKGRCLFIGIK